MMKFITYFFDKWWRPILYFGFSLGLIIVNIFTKNNIFKITSYIFFGLGLIGLIVSIIYQITKSRWIKAIMTGLVLCGTIAAYIFYTLFFFFIETVDGDKWADNLKIPTNIQLDTPIDLSMGNFREGSVIESINTKTNFQLFNSFQPGLYEFDFWTGKIESGTIYLKAFEISQEYPLSTDRLPKSSAIKIYNPTDSIMKFSTSSNFTIYEGDWGKPYAARFEVWFKPDNLGKERLLFMKNYIVEGWQR